MQECIALKTLSWYICMLFVCNKKLNNLNQPFGEIQFWNEKIRNEMKLSRVRHACCNLEFFNRKCDFSTMASPNCLIFCCIQTTCICVRIMFLLLCILAHTVRICHFCRPYFILNFWVFSLKNYCFKTVHQNFLLFLEHKNNIHLHLLYNFEPIKFNLVWEIEFQSKWFQNW